MYVAQFVRSTISALFQTPLSSFLPQVKGELAANNIDVVSVSSTAPQLAGGTYVFTLLLNPTGDYGEINDIKAVADHAFYDALGQLPSASRISLWGAGTTGDDQLSSGQSNDQGISWGWVAAAVGIPLAGLIVLRVVTR
jgi:hypothetical protein